jgi:hypothetical protein
MQMVRQNEWAHFKAFCDELRDTRHIPNEQKCREMFDEVCLNPKGLSDLRKKLSKYPLKKAAMDPRVKQFQDDYSAAFDGAFSCGLDAAAVGAVMAAAIENSTAPAPAPTPPKPQTRATWSDVRVGEAIAAMQSTERRRR